MAVCWFLDFDDTLASGATTWGLKHALPRLIETHHLPYEAAELHAATLEAQERANQVIDPRPVLGDLFDRLGWPQRLQAEFLRDVQTGYQPEVFPDALPFLQQAQARGEAVYIISNNPNAPDIAARLGLTPYIQEIYTPRAYPGARPKPHPGLWYYVLAHNPAVDPLRAVMVGDDPWSDGAFASACGLPYWIVDRDERFGTLAELRRVKSLAEIPLDGL